MAGNTPGQPVGLLTSLPLIWAETGDLADHLNAPPPHWALAVLAEAGTVRPLDTLADGEGAMPLPAGGLLVLAQPRPLSPPENVALDSWVRAGGRVLLFADPMLTFESAFGLGDKRRPQDVVLLSPILTRWGLELEFDEAQDPDPRALAFEDAALPVALAGRFRLGGGDCQLLAEGVIAECRIGAGRVLAVADAALLESSGPDGAAGRAKALGALLHRLTR